MRVTETNSNARSNFCGSRISIYLDDGTLVDRFVVPVHGAKYYCKKHPSGKYGKRYYAAISRAMELEANKNG